jgi:hypothetical protein
MFGIEEGPHDGGFVTVTYLKMAIETYCYQRGMKYNQFSELVNIDTTRIARIRGARKKGGRKPEKPNAALIEEVYEACKKVGVFEVVNASGATVRSLYRFSIIGRHVKPSEYRQRYGGEWFGIAASTVNKGLFVVFSIRLNLNERGFNVTYEQKDTDSNDFTKYRGSAYTILDQVWVFMEEEGDREFVVMNFQKSPQESPRSLFGVYMGRGGSVAASHPAAAKVGLVRTSECPRLEEAKRLGWVEMDQLAAWADEKRSVQEILEHVSTGDVVLRTW